MLRPLVPNLFIWQESAIFGEKSNFMAKKIRSKIKNTNKKERLHNRKYLPEKSAFLAKRCSLR